MRFVAAVLLALFCAPAGAAELVVFEQKGCVWCQRFDREIAPAYDAWMPMSYWTSRTPASGYRDAYRYTAENIDRLRGVLSSMY